MKACRAFNDSEIEEVGEIKSDQVIQLIEEAKESLWKKRKFGIGVYRSEKDFMEIHPVGNDKYLIWSDVIALPFLKRLFSRNHISPVVSGMDVVINVICSYIEKSRIEFEKDYR